MSEQLKTLKEELQTNRSSVESLQSQLVDSNLQRDLALKEVSLLREELKKAEDAVASGSQDILSLTEKNASLASENHNLEEVSNRLKEETAAAIEQARVAESIVRDADVKVNTLEEAGIEMNGSIVDKTNQIDLLSVNVAYLKEELAKSEKARTVLEQELFCISYESNRS